MLNNISILDIDYLDNINIIDIRNSLLYNNGHIKGAVNIPFDKLLLNPDKYINKNFKYYIYYKEYI